MPRPVAQFSQKALLEKLTESHGEFIIKWVTLTSSDIAAWLGTHPATVRRWRRDLTPGQDFPLPDKVIPIPGMRGAGEGYAWKPSSVMSWLFRTGRLIP